jgi:hypothetical protein
MGLLPNTFATYSPLRLAVRINVLSSLPLMDRYISTASIIRGEVSSTSSVFTRWSWYVHLLETKSKPIVLKPLMN